LLCIYQGVRAVIAENFDERHRQALVGVGVLPLEFVHGQTSQSLQLTGRETFTIRLDNSLTTHQRLTVIVSITTHHCNGLYCFVQ